MKIKTSTALVYRTLHGWFGLAVGLTLFIAFFAGSLSAFKGPIQLWASPPAPPLATPLAQTPLLIERALRAHPEAANEFLVMLEPSPAHPGRISWKRPGEAAGHDSIPPRLFADLDKGGHIKITDDGPSSVAQQIVQLHLKMGLPFDEAIAMPIAGALSMLYFAMLVSGTIILLPSMASNLFAMRFSGGIKRMWLDLHASLGLFSLPFHVVMALTAIAFSWQNYIEQVQAVAFGTDSPPLSASPLPVDPAAGLMTPQQILSGVARAAPGFKPQALLYKRDASGRYQVQVLGTDPRYGLRGPTSGIAGVDPYSGAIISTVRLPGQQDAWRSTEANIHALHFGNYGGLPVRWAYFLLGLGGCGLIFSGNLLWIESRRRKSRKGDAGPVAQPRSTRLLGALGVGAPLGCIAGIAATIAAAKLLTGVVADLPGWHLRIYYALFGVALLWPFVRGVARGGIELLFLTAGMLALIPLTSLASALVPIGWNHGLAGLPIDITALAGAVIALMMAKRVKLRSRSEPTDSLWHIPEGNRTNAADRAGFADEGGQVAH
ncbi:PepSY-associated TM helix domain-containing protein [Sphingopyxis kveilinensis]|uniref:PepSY-associated TM helix domain-containing protein n=1 Tax=Sphingopyxis kveilinensis TaxID=3114367 RepID=UPI0030D08721